MEVSTALIKAHNKAKIALLNRKDTVFITTVLFALKHVWDDSMPTAWTDGKSLGINPAFYENLSHKEKQTLLAHEAYHVAFNHMVRGKNLDKRIYNMAADYAINRVLDKAKFVPIKGWLLDYKYDDMSANTIYKLLMQNPPPPKQNQPNGGGNGEPDFDGGDLKTIKSGDPKAAKKAHAIKEIITRASIAKKMQDKREVAKGNKPGSLPGDIEEMINEFANPKLPWNVILQHYMTEYDKSDYSFAKPNRRFAPDYYLPSAHGESMAEIALGFDTSCSVSRNELKQYLTEADSIINRLEPLRTTIASFDHKLQKVDVLEKGVSVEKVKLIGRGGTDLEPLFEYYNKNKPTVLLVFSDLECNPVEKPDYPVIWIAVGGHTEWSWKPDFGTYIEYPLEKDW